MPPPRGAGADTPSRSGDTGARLDTSPFSGVRASLLRVHPAGDDVVGVAHGILSRLHRPSIAALVPADLFDAWLFAATDATLAMADWRFAPPEDKGDAYAAYVAALDREDQAARLLELRLSYA
jgi:hypothetical protein